MWSAVGVSVALMAPSMAININPQGTAAVVGRAVPLTFLLASVAVLLIAHTFVRLSQRFNHAGSVYAFVGLTLGAGPEAWRGGSMPEPICSTAPSPHRGRHLPHRPGRKVFAPRVVPEWYGYVFAWAVLAGVCWMAVRDIRAAPGSCW